MPRPMQKMIAIDRMRYGTRRLLPGDEFECKPAEARIWVAIKKAKEAPLRPPVPLAPPPAALTRRVPRPAAETLPPPPPPVVEADPAHAESQPETPTADEAPETIADADLAATREEYQTKLGKRPFHGWDAAELRRRIAEAE